MTDTELCENGVDRSKLNSGATTLISQFRGVDVILPIRDQERKCRKPVNNGFAGPWANESLQQFLQNQTRSYNAVSTIYGAHQRRHLGGVLDVVTPEPKRPNAGINEKNHRRARSAL